MPTRPKITMKIDFCRYVPCVPTVVLMCVRTRSQRLIRALYLIWGLYQTSGTAAFGGPALNLTLSTCGWSYRRQALQAFGVGMDTPTVRTLVAESS